jgi:hypothetical protein
VLAIWFLMNHHHWLVHAVMSATLCQPIAAGAVLRVPLEFFGYVDSFAKPSVLPIPRLC